MYTEAINPLDDIIKTPPRSSQTKKRMRTPLRTPLPSPLQTGNPNPFTIQKKVIGFPLLPFNRNNDPNVIIGNSIDGLGMTSEAVERLINERFINAKEHDDSAKKTQKTSKTKKMKLILPEITPISNKSSKSRQGKRPRGRPPSLATKKSGGKRTRKQIKKHKKSSKSKKA
jgi:hypothetical protein